MRPPSGVRRALVFGVVSGAPTARDDLALVCTALASALQAIVIPLLAGSYASLSQQLSSGRVHLAWTPPLVAAEFEIDESARPLLAVVRSGRADYHSALFVRSNSPARALEDLRGAHVAWVDPSSSSGCLMPRLHLEAKGYVAGSFFGRQSYLRTHAAVARAVMQGNADVGATYMSVDGRTGSVPSGGWNEVGASADQVRVLLRAGPIPADSIVVSPLVPAEVRLDIAHALQSLPRRASEPLRRLMHADTFEPPKSGHIEDLKRLVAASRRLAG